MKSFLIISFLVVLNTSMVYANGCVDPKVSSKKYEIEANITGEIDSTKLGLKFTIRNTSKKRLRVPLSIFDRKSIQLSLVASFSLSPEPLEDQTYIHPHMPWGDVILDPEEEYSETINLSEGFKSLSKDLNISSVVVFWRVGSESGSNDLCYEEGGYFVLPKVFSQEHEDEIQRIADFLDEQNKINPPPLPPSIEEINLKLKKIHESRQR